MKTKSIFSFFAILCIFMYGYCPQATAESREKAGAITTGLEDQTAVAITIYNVNLGLVKDQRQIKLQKGEGEVRFMDVASQIIPASVYIKSLIDSDSLLVLEQNYEYDLLNPQKLLDKYVGKDVKLYYKNPYTEREEIVTATLLSNNGGPIFKIGNEITFGHPGRSHIPWRAGKSYLKTDPCMAP